MPTEGRAHGQKWACTTCASADRMIRRNLGEKPQDMSLFSVSERHEFFQKLHAEKQASTDPKMNWVTVRASLVTSLTTKTLTSQENKVKAKFLPLSVYLSQGWDQEIVTKCEKEWSEELQCETFRVPVKQQSWSQVHQQVTESLLQQEKQAFAKKKAKGGKSENVDTELDLPAAPQEHLCKDKSKTEAQQERERDRLEKKQSSENQKQHLLAARHVGMLTQALASVQKMRLRLSETPLEQGVRQTADNCESTLISWVKAAKEVLAKSEEDSVKKGLTKLDILPFDKESAKATSKQATVVVGSLKKCLPEPTPKAKAKAKANSGPKRAAEKEAAQAAVTPTEEAKRRKTTKSK